MLDEVARLGPAREAGDGRRAAARRRCGALADLAGDGVGVVGHVDPAPCPTRSDFDIFLVPSRRFITRIAGPSITGSVQREEVHPEVVVELRGDVAGQLDVLLLVLAHRHVGGVVEQDVGRHQRRDRRRGRARLLLGVLAGLVLELRHPVHPAHAGDAVEDPGQLGVLGHLGLVEEDRALGVDARGDEARRDLAGRARAARPGPARR